MWCDVVLKVVVLLVVAHFIKGMAVTADILHSERDMHLHLASGMHCSTMAPQARVVVVVVVVLFKVVPQTGVDAFFYTCRRLQN